MPLTSSLHRSIGSHPLTHHAALRMQQRGISPRLIELALRYGRTVNSRGVSYRIVGHKEVQRFARDGIDLSKADGVHVLVGVDGAVVTAYRNHDLRKVKPGGHWNDIHHLTA